MTILEFKTLLKQFYSKYDIYIKALLKFVTALTAFFMLNGRMGFMPQLRSPMISVAMAVFCAFLPSTVMVVLAGILLILQAYALSVEVCAVLGAILAVMFLLYFRFCPKQGYLLVLTPLSFSFGVPYVIPLVMGLIGTPAAIIPVSCGVVIYHILKYLNGNTTILANSGTELAMEKVQALIENMTGNYEMLVYLAAFAITLLVVYFIRRLSVDYAWGIAIAVGTVADLFLNLAAGLVLKVNVPIAALIIGNMFALVIAYILQFFVFSVDYTRTERVQFEDDEYYYYVKAVPKNVVAVPEKKVKKIVSQKKVRKQADD
ncbi:MAG: hypothetical protein ACI4DV_09435 [Lachnospiraceae bacterium]